MSYQLTIEPLGATIEVQEGQTMLDAALRHGIYLPHACGHGLCGSCKVQVCDGEVDHGAANPFALLEFEKDEGFTYCWNNIYRIMSTYENYFKVAI